MGKRPERFSSFPAEENKTQINPSSTVSGSPYSMLLCSASTVPSPLDGKARDTRTGEALRLPQLLQQEPGGMNKERYFDTIGVNPDLRRRYKLRLIVQINTRKFGFFRTLCAYTSRLELTIKWTVKIYLKVL